MSETMTILTFNTLGWVRSPLEWRTSCLPLTSPQYLLEPSTEQVLRKHLLNE